MQIFARVATAVDIKFLSDLEREARFSITSFRGADRLASDIPEVGDSWQMVLSDRNFFTLIGGIDTSIMGYLVARVSGQVALIEQVFVTKDARNLGIGDALVSAVLALAAEKNLAAVDALALPGDRETKNLFERSGLVARLITVTKKIN